MKLYLLSFFAALFVCGSALAQPTLTIRNNQSNAYGAVTESVFPTALSNNTVELTTVVWTWSGAPGATRSFFMLDLSPLAGMAIDSVILQLYANPASPSGYTGQPTYGTENTGVLYRVTSPWDTAISWLTMPPYTNVDSVVLPQSASTNQNYLHNDVTNMVNDMLVSGNYGFMFKIRQETTHYNSMIFYSSNVADSNVRPALLVYGDHAPHFTGGTTQFMSVCENSTANSLNSQLAVIDTDEGQTETWALVSGPSAGTATVSYSTISTGGVVTPTGLSYTPSPGFTGTDSITVSVYDGKLYGYTTIYITVNPSLTAISPTSAAVCVGSSVNFTDGTGGGVWSLSNSHATNSGGTVFGVSAGIDTLTYSNGTCSVTARVTVNALPAAISPSVANLCTGTTMTLTDGTFGGAWSASNSHATVVGGLVTAVTAGIDTISYTQGGCAATAVITVVNGPAAISPGSATVCAGNTVTFSDGTGGGAWTMTNSHATNSGPTVTGVSVGVDTVKYTVGSCFSSAYVTVNNAPAPILPTSTTLCAGGSTTLSDGTPSGVWSATNSHATVSGGFVSALTVGVDTIKYTVGACFSSATVTVVTSPAAISPSTATVCTGSTVSLTDGTGGGTWSVSNFRASVASGLVAGLSAGIDTVTYAIGSCSVTATVTVNNSPAAISPSGAVSICSGSTATLTDGTPSGAWSVSNAHASVVGGVVTGLSAGIDTVSYTAGGCPATKPVTIIAAPVAISPSSASVCIGNTVNLVDGTSGGSWSASNSNATVSGGIVTGVAVGADTITYSVGSCFVTGTVTVNAAPSAILPSTPVSMCVGNSSLLTDPTPGGVWTSNATGNATVSGGLVTGVAPGVVTISYTNSSSCSATKQITVNITPTAITPSSANVCVGGTTTLVETIGGGTWSTDAPGVATVAGGVVSGVTPGTANITYTIGSCTATATVTVSSAPSAGSITGPSSVCVGSAIHLLDGVSGGVWSSSLPSVGTVSATGFVTGISGGTTVIAYTFTNVCGAVATTATVTVVPAGVGTIGGPSSICSGTFVTLTDVTTGGSWSASNAHATITGGGLLTGISAGTDTITYTVVNVCGSSSTTKVISVGAFLTAGTITGGNVVCVGSHITLADLAPGGLWSATNTNATVAGGTVTGAVAGVDTVNFTVTSTCGSAIASHTVTVNPLASAGSITGSGSICIGGPATYTDTVSGGVWSMSNAHATIAGGVVTPVSTGIDTVIYTVTTSCGTSKAKFPVSIGAFLTAGTIAGSNAVCVGSSITLTDATGGGTWSASNTSASVVGGTVSGLIAGIDTISYTVSGSCGTVAATQIVSVNPIPVAGSISGPASICMGATTTYTDAAPGGAWTMTNANASVLGGVVTPLAAGNDTIVYTVINSCGTDIATRPITIGAVVTAGSISGSNTMCLGATVNLLDGVPGGTWSASNVHASVTSGGVVTGLEAGVDTISYTVSASCGSVAATYPVTVYATTPAGTITGTTELCFGSSTPLSDAVSGGVWSITNANATISPLGVLVAITPGADTAIYTVNGVCGIASASAPITIDGTPTAGTITGPNNVCVGASMTLADAVSGGVWSALNPFATIGSSSGHVTGVATGVDIISYTVTNTCGTAAIGMMVTVNAAPTSGSISGPDTVCLGSTITLTDAAGGGTWSAGNTNATVSSSGVVNGVTIGTDPITYTVSTSCGTSTAVAVVDVSTLTLASAISGISNICAGSSITLTDAVSGGVWTASNANAMVTGPGIIEGMFVGVDTITYTVSSGVCGSSNATKVVSVNPLPFVAAISGPTTQCVSSTMTLTDPTIAGIWTSSNPTVATVVLGSGAVTGVGVGVATITYTVTNIFGCPATVSAQDTVSSLSVTPSISGSSTLCVGATTPLSDLVAGGTWTSASPSVATIGSGSGIVTGVSAGTASIVYTFVNSCGTLHVTTSETVNPLPVVAAIGGTSSECAGSTTTLTDGTPSGAWTSSNAAISTVGTGTGIVTGIAAGMDTIMYSVTNTFGCSASAMVANTVNVSPLVAGITGVTHQCFGATSSLADVTSGGAWTTSDPTIAAVAGGTVTGIAPGTATISYSVAGGGCTTTVSVADTVNTIPVPSPISGSGSLCVGGTSLLSDVAPGGSWSSRSTSIATISISGLVTALATGTDEVYYAISNSCGSVTDSMVVTVSSSPSAGTISGSSAVCQGSSVTLTDAVSGGSWSITNGRATISSGVVTGVTTGTDTVRYTVTGGCGTVTATKVIGVSAAPFAGAISGFSSVCEGRTIGLSESAAGGSWSSSNSSVASVSGGTVTGVSAGSATINYSVSNSCGTRTANHAVSVISSAQCNVGTSVATVGSPDEIKIYPNPATDVLNIESSIKVNITVLSIEGKVLLTKDNATAIDVSNLANAMYIIMIRDQDGNLLKVAKFSKVN